MSNHPWYFIEMSNADLQVEASGKTAALDVEDVDVDVDVEDGVIRLRLRAAKAAQLRIPPFEGVESIAALPRGEDAWWRALPAATSAAIAAVLAAIAAKDAALAQADADRIAAFAARDPVIAARRERALAGPWAAWVGAAPPFTPPPEDGWVMEAPADAGVRRYHEVDAWIQGLAGEIPPWEAAIEAAREARREAARERAR